MKTLGIVVSDMTILENCISWPSDLFMQPIETVETTLVGDQPGILPVKFGQNPIGDFIMHLQIIQTYIFVVG